MFELQPFEARLFEIADKKKPAVIAEIKRASPSKGILTENFSPSDIAAGYQSAGAACISVLTDKNFFKGSIDDLVEVRRVCQVPLLRKDFVIDPYQIYQARAYGADCILLIVAALSESQMAELEDVAMSLGMSVLVEVHTEPELERALSCKTNLIGINNRNLSTFEVDIKQSFRLKTIIPRNKLVISESGISSHENMKELMNIGVYCFLIGESLMRTENPGIALELLLQKF